MKLDNTLSEIKNSSFYNSYNRVIKQMLKQTSFSDKELSCILMVYYKFVLANKKPEKFMSQVQFANVCHIIFEINDHKIVTRIFESISKGSRRHIKPEQWVKLFSIYVNNSLEEQMDFCFAVYDEEEEGFLTHDVMKKFINTSYLVEDDDDAEGMRDEIIDLIIRRMDKDRDGVISYNDYTSSVREKHALMEFLGQCIPHKDALMMAAHCCNIVTIFDQYKI